MKLSDYIVQFLADHGLKHAFVITGGASVHMIDSLAKNPEINYVCAQHEQASAMMADAYSRVSGNLGVAISTSGPGATNMITGVSCAYYDSIPVLYLTGQVTTFRLKKDRGIRQLGFQETDTVDIFKPITKYAVMVQDANRIKYELEKAVDIAKSGRPGPVLIDIPDDLQRADIDPSSLESYSPEIEVNVANENALNEKISECIRLINQSKRPVVVLGWGVRLSKSEKEAMRFIETLGFPVLMSFAMRDFLASSSPLAVGSFGSHGTRYGNFTIQNSDLVIAVGSRLDSRKSGSPPKNFAREAKKIIVDIDQTELSKFKDIGINADLLLQTDCKKFFKTINNRLGEISAQDISPWKTQIADWKNKFPICPPEYYRSESPNPYVFIKTLSEVLKDGDIIISDTGCGLVWAAQAFEFKEKQRFIHAFNFTPMGYALPASIGACFANNGKRVICLSGDGGLQMNIQELATVIRHKLPIKVILINNNGYSMIGQTQDQWLDSRYEASTVEHGLAFPDFEKLAVAYGFRTLGISRNKDILGKLTEFISGDDPSFCNINISFDQKVIPQVKYGRPLEDADPLLPRNTFFENMIIKPTEVSLKKE